ACQVATSDVATETGKPPFGVAFFMAATFVSGSFHAALLIPPIVGSTRQAIGPSARLLSSEAASVTARFPCLSGELAGMPPFKMLQSKGLIFETGCVAWACRNISPYFFSSSLGPSLVQRF